MELGSFIPLAAHVMEVAGVGAMVLGAVLATVLLVVRRGLEPNEAYHRFRLNLGRAILLGLEFLVAADIIRTVSEEPSLRGVIVLGLIVLIRTFLSFTLTVELEGRWPWQKGEAAVAPVPGPRFPPEPSHVTREPSEEEPRTRH
jgi:uncharacterized membrane protein